MSSNRPNICFVAPNNYAVLSGDPNVQHIGGAEVQRALIAHELVKRGWQVSFVTLDHGQADGIEHDGIRVFKAYGKNEGGRGIRFFHPRWTGLNAAMQRADADIYIQRTAGIETGQVAHWTRRNGRKFVYAVASEPECDRRVGNRTSWRERAFFKYGLRRADAVVAQTRRQVELLKQTYSINAHLIRSAGVDPKPNLTDESLKQRLQTPRILWVGRFSRPKRVDRLLSIARACSEYQFDIVGDHPNPAPDIAAAVADLREQANVTMHGFVPYREVGTHFDRAAALLCTSEWEGFPNTFIEAWSRGIPVLSSVDPDEIINENQCGATWTEDKQVSPLLKTLFENPQEYIETARRARDCFTMTHTIDQVASQWEALLIAIVNQA